MRDYLSEMLNALTSAYSRNDYNNRQRDSPLETNIGKLFAVLAWGLDSVSEQAELIKLWDNIDNAYGSVLDRYGANFGVNRKGSSDAFYRLLIKVKLISQLSGGDINTVINAATSLFGVSPESITLTELFPAKINIGVNEADLDSETFAMVEDIALMIKRILAAGVGLITTLQSYRGFSNTIGIRTARFDRSKLTFNIPDAERTFIDSLQLKHAMFEYSRLRTKPRDANRTLIQDTQLKNAMFEYCRLKAEPPAKPRKLTRTHSMSFVVFAHVRLEIRPIH